MLQALGRQTQLQSSGQQGTEDHAVTDAANLITWSKQAEWGSELQMAPTEWMRSSARSRSRFQKPMDTVLQTD